MKTIKHYLTLETELIDEKNKTSKVLLSMPKDKQEKYLTALAYSVLSSAIEKELATLNEGNSFAVLKLVK